MKGCLLLAAICLCLVALSELDRLDTKSDFRQCMDKHQYQCSTDMECHIERLGVIRACRAETGDYKTKVRGEQ